MSLVIHKMLDEAEVPLGDSLEDRIGLLLADYQRLLKMTREQTQLTDRQRLLARLEEDPCDVLLMLADACTELGLDAEAKGWGWLGQARKWPGRVSNGFFWVEAGPWSYSLPRQLFPYVSEQYRSICYPTARAALEAVVAAIASGAQP